MVTTQSRYLIRSLFVPGAIAIALGIAVFIAFNIWTVFSQASTAKKTSIKVAEAAISNLHRVSGAWALDYAYWDELIENAILRTDREWLNANIADAVVDTKLLDLVAIIGVNDQANHSYVDGPEVVDPIQLRQDLDSLIITARQIGDPGADAKSGFLIVNGALSACGASPVTPQGLEGSPTLPAGSRPVVVFCRTLDAQDVADLGAQFDLPGLSFYTGSAPDGLTTLAVSDPANFPVGGFAWEPEGISIWVVLQLLVPIVLAGTFLFFALRILRQRADAFLADVEEREQNVNDHQKALLDILRTNSAEAAEAKIAIEAILAKSCIALKLSDTTFWKFNDDYSEMTAHAGWANDAGDRGRPLGVDTVPTSKLLLKRLKQQEIVAVSDAAQEDDTPRITRNDDDDRARAFLFVPVKAHGRVMGIVVFNHSEAVKEWSSSEITFATAIANLVALAIAFEEQRNSTARLREAKSEADSASRAKSDFLAAMSHEIRTPLNAVLGLSDVLLKELSEGSVRDKISAIRSSGESLLRLLNDILDISKVESGALEISTSEFLIGDMVKDVEALWSDTVRAKDLRFYLDQKFPADLQVEADRGRLLQILHNLIGNSLKFTDRGAIYLTVEAQNNVANRWQLAFSIRDTGMGISPDEQKKIFEKFSQSKQVVTKGRGGSGLGLSISQHLAQLMGGRIRLESELGVGSTFILEIPVKGKQIPIADEIAPKRASPRPGTPLSILVAEDIELNQEVVRVFLENDGHKVTFANNGIEAVDACRSGHFDLVLMDIQMPEMDGIEATKRIRDLAPPHGDVPIIALTAHAMSGHKEEYLGVGMNGYVSKPVRMDALREAIEGALSAEASQDSQGRTATLSA